MFESTSSTERLRRLAERWSSWSGPAGDQERYKGMAIALTQALDALTELTELRTKLAEATETARRLEQANGDLRRERDRAVEEAQRQDAVAKGLRAQYDAVLQNISASMTYAEAPTITIPVPDYMADLQRQLAATTERAEKESREASRLRDLNWKIQNELDIAQQAVEAWVKRGDYWLQERQELIERAEKAERERSIGAEEELRRIAEEDCDTVFLGDLPHITRTQLLDRADAIAAERKEGE